jgi:hypothetical protein
MGSTTHKHFLKLVHRSLFFKNFRVNNAFAIGAISPDLQTFFDHSRFLRVSIFVNKSVDMNFFTDLTFLLICSQFIERTEMDGGSQQIEVDYLKDTPR